MNFDTDMTRREFLYTLTMAGAAASLLPLAASAQPVAAKFVAAGKADSFKTGEFKQVVLPGNQTIYVRRLAGKTPKFLALSAKCTHKGCTVGWNPSENTFKCPCHGGQFDAGGKNISGPPPAPLASLPTKVQKGMLLIHV